jgi:hypothetical protein
MRVPFPSMSQRAIVRPFGSGLLAPKAACSGGDAAGSIGAPTPAPGDAAPWARLVPQRLWAADRNPNRFPIRRAGPSPDGRSLAHKCRRGRNQTAKAHGVEPETCGLRPNVGRLMDCAVGVKIGVAIETGHTKDLVFAVAVLGLIELLLRKWRQQKPHSFVRAKNNCVKFSRALSVIWLQRLRDPPNSLRMIRNRICNIVLIRSRGPKAG